MTAGEDQPEPLVIEGASRLAPVVVAHHLSLLLLVVALVLPSDAVDGLAVGGGGQPAARVGRYAIGRPPLNRGRERFRRRVLGDVEVTETPSQGGDHPRPLLTVGPGDHLPDVDPAHAPRNGRTSTFRLQAFEPSAASLSATSRSGASMIQNPAMYSFVSRKGPSVNNASPPRLSMTVAELGDASPPAKTQWPSAWSRSLNALMAAISSGVAEPAVSSITETRYCISDHLLGLGAPSLAAARLVGQVFVLQSGWVLAIGLEPVGRLVRHLR